MLRRNSARQPSTSNATWDDDGKCTAINNKVMRRNSAASHPFTSNATWNDSRTIITATRRHSDFRNIFDIKKEPIFAVNSVEKLFKSLHTGAFCGKLDPVRYSMLQQVVDHDGSDESRLTGKKRDTHIAAVCDNSESCCKKRKENQPERQEVPGIPGHISFLQSESASRNVGRRSSSALPHC